MRTSLLVLLLTLCGGCRGVQPPDRAPGIPESAVWAGGADGGAWIDCEYKFKEPHVGYSCATYNDFTGDLWASGVFVLGELRDGEFQPLAGPFQGGSIGEYAYYDGETIGVSRTRLLVPTGWIDYPFGDGHGKRTRYILGKEQEVVSY